MYLSQDLTIVVEVTARRPAPTTDLPDPRRWFTRGTKSLSEETITNVSTWALWSSSTASIVSFMSQEFLPALVPR